MLLSQLKCKMRSTSGLSLMEVAMLLMILGLLMAGFLAGYRVYQAQRGEQLTTRSFDEIEEAIAGYVAKNGRYPVPMGLATPNTDPEYGYSGSMITGCPGSANPPPITGNRVCRSNAPVPGPQKVLLGAVPFKELNIAESFIYDAFKRRITYIVGEDLTVGGVSLPANKVVCAQKQTYTPTYNLDTGGANCANNLEDIALISHGVDGYGAYTVSGDRYRDCNSGGTQDENCNYDGTVIDATLEKSTGSGPEKNDDRISFDMKLDPNLWLKTGAGIYNTTVRQVGIGIEKPAETLDVAGNIKAAEIRTGTICSNDPTGTSATGCFDPNVIAGPLGMKCLDTQVLTSISNAAPGCTPVLSPTLNTACASNEYIAGIAADGSAICRTAAPP